MPVFRGPRFSRSNGVLLTRSRGHSVLCREPSAVSGPLMIEILYDPVYTVYIYIFYATIVPAVLVHELMQHFYHQQ